MTIGRAIVRSLAYFVIVVGLILSVIYTLTPAPWDQYHGMTERGYNRGPFIDTANKRYAYTAAPYCASGLSVMLDRIRATAPRYRGGASRRFISADAITATRVRSGKDTLPIPSIAVWTRPGGGGHVALVLGRVGDAIYTFEFNTSSGSRGSQWNGAWSGYRTRSLSRDASPLNAMRITHFSPLTTQSHEIYRSGFPR